MSGGVNYTVKARYNNHPWKPPSNKSFHKNSRANDEPAASPPETSPPSTLAADKEPGSTERQEHERQEEGQSYGQEKEHGKKRNKPHGPAQHGNHWGLLVIDKAEKVARWVDSAITLKQRSDKPNKLMFEHMHPAAITAGQVLCGIDTLLGEENGFFRGDFTTSTLKYVPQQGTNNSYSGHDGGPCGPFLFAFLEYILERATRLDRFGLRKMFSKSERGQLEFNSMHARQEMRRLIQEESEQPNVIPFQLSPDLLRILNIVPVEKLQSSVDAYQDKASVPNRPFTKQPHKLPRGFEPDPLFLAAFKQDKRESPEVYKDLKNDAEALALFYMIQQSGFDAHGKATGKGGANGPGTASQGFNKTVTDIHLGRQLYRNIPLDDKTIWPPHDEDSGNWPRNVKELPDFTKVDNKGLIRWLNANHDIRERLNENKKHSHVTSRAMLHLKFKRTFLGESDDNFKSVWSQDETVFNPHDSYLVAIKDLQDDKLKYGEMRLLMMRHYEANTLTALFANLAKYKPDTPASGKKGKDDDEDNNDDDKDEGYPDNDGNKPGQSSNGDKKNRSGTGQNGDENGDAFPNQGPNEFGPDINEIDPYAPTNGNISNCSQPTPKPSGLLDFRAMPEIDLVEYQTPEKLVDPRLQEQNVNIVSWRAFLFATVQDERFGDESDYNCINLWLRDTIIFSDEDRKSDWTEFTDVIRSRMEAHYCPPTSPSPTPGSGQVDPIDDITMRETEEELNPEPSESSDGSEDGSNGLGLALIKRKRGAGESRPEGISSNKKKKCTISGFRGPKKTPNDSPAQLLGQPRNDKDETSGIKPTKGKRSTRDAQCQKALRAAQALQDAANAVQDFADGLNRLTFPALAVSTPHASGDDDDDDDDDDRFTQAYRETGSTQASPRPYSTARGDSDGIGSESSSEPSGLSDPPDPDDSDDFPTSSESENSDSDDNNDLANSGRKRRRDSEDDSTEIETVGSKKAKTSHLPSLGESEAATDPNSSGVDDLPSVPSNDPKDHTIVDEPPDPQVTSSFESDSTVEDPTIEVYIGREPYILNPEDATLFLPWDNTKQDWPMHISQLPDFAHIDASDFKLWYTSSPELRAKLGAQNDKANLVTYRAELHMKFKKTFLHEQDANFSNVWIHDATVFNAPAVAELQAIKDPRIRNGEIRRRVMAAYEPATLQRLADLPKPIPKLTVQAASFEDPESFDSDTVFVEVTRKPGLPEDPALLSPRTTGTIGRPKYGLQTRSKLSKKLRES